MGLPLLGKIRDILHLGLGLSTFNLATGILQLSPPTRPGHGSLAGPGSKIQYHVCVCLEECRIIVKLTHLIIFAYSYLQYLELCSRIVRSCLKEEFKAAAVKRGEEGLKFAKWSEGKQGESSK